MKKTSQSATIRFLAPALLVSGMVCSCRPAPSAGGQGAESQILAAVPLAQSAASVEFSQITGIGVDTRGQVYAGDRLGEIIVLDERGELVRRFGRMGGGPGEYQLVSTLHVLEGDSLFVFDGIASRTTVYAPHSGQVAYTTRLPEPNFSYPMTVEPMSGNLIGHFRRISGNFPGAAGRRDDLIRLLNRDGSIRRDSVVRVREPEVAEIKGGKWHGFYTPDWARQTLVRWDEDGRIYALRTDSTEVTVYEATGRVFSRFSAAVPTEPIPLRDATIDSVAQQNGGEGITPRMLAEAFRSRWQTWPLVEDMLVDDQRRIWIKPMSHDSIGEWLAFTPHGQKVASFQLPRMVTPRLIRGDRLYGVSRDSLDVESVVVYRLTPSSTRTAGRP